MVTDTDGLDYAVIIMCLGGFLDGESLPPKREGARKTRRREQKF